MSAVDAPAAMAVRWALAALCVARAGWFAWSAIRRTHAPIDDREILAVVYLVLAALFVEGSVG